jgi:DNA-binding NarL/FixJ family response regulator
MQGPYSRRCGGAADPETLEIYLHGHRLRGVLCGRSRGGNTSIHRIAPPSGGPRSLDLSDLGGHDPILEIRRCSDVPVIALSGRQPEAYLVAAFDHGADDYVEKPFRVSELLAPIRSLLRRGIKAKAEESVYHCGTLIIDIVERRVTRGSEPIRLAPTEFEILSLLVHNSGRVVPYQTCGPIESR